MQDCSNLEWTAHATAQPVMVLLFVCSYTFNLVECLNMFDIQNFAFIIICMCLSKVFECVHLDFREGEREISLPLLFLFAYFTLSK